MTAPNGHCNHLVDDYLHELLEPSAAREIETHCEECPECRTALDQARKRLEILQVLPPREATEELINKTVAGVKDHQQRQQNRRQKIFGGLFGVIAASAVIITGLQIYYANLTPTPFDLKLLGQASWIPGAPASLRVRLMDRPRGLALAGIPVEISLRRKGTNQTQILAQFQTDAQGTSQPRFVVPEWSEGDCELQVVARPSGKVERLTETVKLKRSWQIMLSSDKPVYQPGQVIHVRSLALRRPDLKPVSGQEAVFTIGDPKGNIIFKQQVKNSPYGIASIDCPLAAEILEGPYTIASSIGDTVSQLTVVVKKYVLPKFKTGLTLDRTYYAPGETMRVTVQADYFFGQPVAKGTVDLEVQAQETETKVLHKSSARTDSRGKAVFTLELPRSFIGRPQDSGDARLAIQALVKDQAGQEQSTSGSTMVTSSPLRLEVITECRTLVPGVPTKVYVFTTYADGQPARAAVEVPGRQEPVLTNHLGVGSFEWTADLLQGIEGVFRARDEKGIVVETFVARPCGRVGQDFLVRTNKAVYAGGETMHLTVLASGPEPVFVDLIKDAQTVLTETVNLTDGRGEYHFDLPPELSGTVQLCAYRLNAEGVPVRKTRTLFIRPAGNLQVKAALDRDEYRPGEKARLQLELRDQKGLPAQGALSLAAVDEAVFSVLEQRPGMEGRFFALEKELLKPIYAIYPWSPDLTNSLPPAERDQLEQALFARTLNITSWNSLGARKEKEIQPARNKNYGLNDPIHSLGNSSFPLKNQELMRTQEKALYLIKKAWVFLGIGVVLLLDLCLWVFIRPITRVAFWHVLSLGFLFFLLLGLLSELSVTIWGTGVSNIFTNVRDQISSAGGGPLPQREARETPPRTFDSVIPVRQLFPETLLWRPELITDDQGRASLDIDLADSITTWRLTASAVAADGRLGATQGGIRVFQPFFVDLNLPVSLTRGDEVAVPVVVYNYLDRPQTVGLTLSEAAWFERLDKGGQRLDLAPREVRSISFPLRVKKVGLYDLQVTAQGSGVADAIKRSIEVVPDGRRVEQVVNGTLDRPGEIDLSLPLDAIEGSPKAILKIYPSNFSQLVEGLDGIFQRPYGCFEQTSSTTYPNVLALDYLRTIGKSAPEVEAKARQYIHLGYQRLLGFEVNGGGFDWFGRPPANRTLTAYGLMEFQDMARVHDVDPNLIDRTRRWLLTQQQRDGSWIPESHALHDDPTRAGRDSDLARLSTTVYIAWAVFRGPSRSSDRSTTRSFMLSHAPGTIDDPHVLALVANALNALDPNSKDAGPYLERLEKLKKSSEDGKFIWWEQSPGSRTTFYGSGQSGSVETTALAVLAMLPHNHNPATVRGALAWLVKQKNATGTWASTQATVLALKALLAGTGKPLGGDGDRRLEIACGGLKRTLVIPANQAEVMQQIDLSSELKPGRNRLALVEHSSTAAGYQVAFRYNVPGEALEGKQTPLAVDLAYDRANLRVEETVTATATIVNRMAQPAPMVILDLPIPAGFTLIAEDLSRQVTSGAIAKFQVNPRSAVVYLRQLEPAQPLKLTYRLKATMPVKVSVSPAQAYEYYNADKKGASRAARMTVTAK